MWGLVARPAANVGEAVGPFGMTREGETGG